MVHMFSKLITLIIGSICISYGLIMLFIGLLSLVLKLIGVEDVLIFHMSEFNLLGSIFSGVFAFLAGVAIASQAKLTGRGDRS